MSFDGLDAKRLKMERWALDIKSRLKNGVEKIQLETCCHSICNIGIRRVRNVISLRAADQRGKSRSRHWEMEWFGGFYWLHEHNRLSDEEAGEFYFSEEIMHFWNGVVDVVENLDSSAFDRTIIDKMLSLLETTTTKEEMIDFKNRLDRLERSRKRKITYPNTQEDPKEMGGETQIVEEEAVSGSMVEDSNVVAY